MADTGGGVNDGRYWFMILLLAGTGLGFHGMPHGRYVPPHHRLADFPQQLGAFVGQNVGLDSSVLDILGEGEFLQRVYRHEGEELPVNLYIGYYPKQETGATVHSPQHCLPGAGWEPLDIGRTQMELSDGRTIEVNRYIVQKGSARLLVLYWYQARGRTIASEYWSKFYLVSDAILANRTDGAIIRISAPVFENETGTALVLDGFVRQVFARLGEFIPD